MKRHHDQANRAERVYWGLKIPEGKSMSIVLGLVAVGRHGNGAVTWAYI